MAAHDPTHKGPFIPVGLTSEEKAHHLEHLPPDLQLSKEELEEYKRARFETDDWFRRSIDQFIRLGNKEKVEELEKRKAAFEARTSPTLAASASGHEAHNESLGPMHHTPQYLDNDERYKKMVEEKVAAWNKEHPNEPLPSEVLITRDDGSRYIHEDITRKLPYIEEEVKKEFAQSHEEDYKVYEENEKSRIYKDKDGNALPENDPAYKKLLGDIGAGMATAKEAHEKSIQEATDTEVARIEEQHAQNAKTTFAYSARKVERGDVEKRIREQIGSSEAMEKASRHEQLLAFVASHPQKAAEYAKKSPELQLALKEYQEKQAREHAQKDVARQVAEGLRKQQLPVDNSLSPEEYAQVAPERVELAAIPVGTSAGSGIEDSYEETTSYPGGGQQYSRSSRRRFSPGGMFQNAGRTAKGIRNAAQTAAKIGNFVAKAAPLLTNPLFWVIVGGVILIVFIIILVVIIAGGSVKEDNTATYPVTITKTGPEEVNPGENITYTINVSYSGPASDIVVTDNIPAGAEFVSASGVYECQPEPSCNPPEVQTITWHANAQSSDSPSGTPSPSPSPSPRPTAQPGTGTIHNLGFGASDAKRIDDLVSALSPGSPVIGQGSWVIERAREFNLDPLMIILFKNESQFCNDTGVVSPGGSDPDNYNCGGILWPSAEQETDTARWSARAGPAAYTHIFTFVPTVQDGIGLFFDYASASFYQGKTLQQFYDIYNPCSDSSQYGLACGAPEAERMLQLLADTLGPACTDGEGCYSGGGGTSFPPMSFTLTIKPLGEGYIINQASAQVR